MLILKDWMFHIFHLVYSLRSEDQVKNIALSTFKIFYFSIKILKIYLVGPRPTNKPTACVSALTPSLPAVVNADTRHISIKKNWFICSGYSFHGYRQRLHAISRYCSQVRTTQPSVVNDPTAPLRFACWFQLLKNCYPIFQTNKC